jgi:hypothetical protein
VRVAPCDLISSRQRANRKADEGTLSCRVSRDRGVLSRNQRRIEGPPGRRGQLGGSLSPWRRGSVDGLYTTRADSERKLLMQRGRLPASTFCYRLLYKTKTEWGSPPILEPFVSTSNVRCCTARTSAAFVGPARPRWPQSDQDGPAGFAGLLATLISSVSGRFRRCSPHTLKRATDIEHD